MPAFLIPAAWFAAGSVATLVLTGGVQKIGNSAIKVAVAGGVGFWIWRQVQK